MNSAAIEEATGRLPHSHNSPFDPAAKFALVADDAPELRAVLKVLLEDRGLVVVTACDGREAVETAPLFPFSLIVTDLEMPVMSGLEAVRRIRAMGGPMASIPVIVFSGTSNPLSAEDCRNAEIDAFVAKGSQQLFKVLDRFIPKTTSGD